MLIILLELHLGSEILLNRHILQVDAPSGITHTICFRFLTARVSLLCHLCSCMPIGGGLIGMIGHWTTVRKVEHSNYMDVGLTEFARRSADLNERSFVSRTYALVLFALSMSLKVRLQSSAGV